MPALLALAALAGLVIWEQQKRAREAGATAPFGAQIIPALSMAQLAPGAAPYLPPIAAPDWVRVTYANAMASGNPIQMVTAAQQVKQAGYPQLALALSQQYQSLTNNPIPGIAGVGWSPSPFAPAGSPWSPMRAPMRQTFAPMAARFAVPGMRPQFAPMGAQLDPRTVQLLAHAARQRRAQRAGVAQALAAMKARQQIQRS